VGEEPLPDPVALTIENADPAGFAIGLPTALPPVLADGLRRAAQLLGNPPPAPASCGEAKDHLDILWCFQRRIPGALLQR